MALAWSRRVGDVPPAGRVPFSPWSAALQGTSVLARLRSTSSGEVLLFNGRGNLLLESFKWSLTKVAFTGRFASRVIPGASLCGVRVSALLLQ